MRATRDWGPCACDCGKNIVPGEEMTIVEGQMYLIGHEERKTRQIQAIASGKKKSGK
jgi:hypothetical protein